jgi:hypothetical protein
MVNPGKCAVENGITPRRTVPMWARCDLFESRIVRDILAARGVSRTVYCSLLNREIENCNRKAEFSISREDGIEKGIVDSRYQ